MPKVASSEIPLDLIGHYPDEWVPDRLENVCIQVTDGTHDSPKPVQGDGYPLITGKSIKGRRISFDTAYNISARDHLSVISRSKPEKGDILFANIGNSIGDLARVDTSREFSIKNVALFKPGAKLQSRFLEYYLFSEQVQSFIRSLTLGSAQPFIGLATLRGLPIPLPELAEQRAIAHILGTLDDKIELNRRTNETLEAMARALFKDWFVDFGPVRAKAEGLAPPGLAPEIAALFPDALDDEDKPVGWTSASWSDLAVLEYGKRLTDYQDGSGSVPVYGTNGPIGWHKSALCSSPGVIIGRKGAYRGVHFSHVPFFVIDTAFYLRPTQSISQRWAYYTILDHDINKMDSGSAIPSTSREEFYALPVVVPSRGVMDAFDNALGPCWVRQQQSALESQTLTQLRDTLLPKLMSGELRVREAERQVEAVL